MNAGRLRHRVNLAAPISTAGLDGHVSIIFGAGTDLWAEVSGQKGEESFAAARTESRRTIKVALRWRDDVSTAWRLTWNGETYDITDVDRSRRHLGELWLMCQGRKVS